MKLINKGIFITVIILNLLGLIFSRFDSYYIFAVLKYLPFLLTVVAFVMFLKDKHYTFKLFFYFLICTRIYGLIIMGITSYSLNYFENINRWLGLAGSIFLIIYGLVGEAFVLAFLYQFFRKKSYKEELEKAKKLLEQNSISQEEFDMVEKGTITQRLNN